MSARGARKSWIKMSQLFRLLNVSPKNTAYHRPLSSVTASTPQDHFAAFFAAGFFGVFTWLASWSNASRAHVDV